MDALSKPPSFRDTLRYLVSVLQIDDVLRPVDLEQGLNEIEMEVVAIAADAQRAEVRRVPLAIAARDYERYPALSRFHAGMEDALTLSLPEELLTWAKKFMDQPPTVLGALATELVAHAAQNPVPIKRNIARVFLYESMRIQLLLRFRWFPEETYGVGMDDSDIDTIAEAEMDTWLKNDVFIFDSNVRPLEVMIASALEQLTHKSELMALALRTVGGELRQVLERRALFERRLAELDASDALLVRNKLSGEFEVQHLSLDLLQERHPAALGGVRRNTLDKRLSRLRMEMDNGPSIIRRSGVTLLDLASEAYRSHGLLSEAEKE